MDKYYDDIRKKLIAFYTEKNRIVKQKTTRTSILFLVVFLLCAVIAFVVNQLFQLQGIPYCFLAPLGVGWILYRRAMSDFDRYQYDWMLQALNGIPNPAAWHAFRIARVFTEKELPLTKNEWTRWLLYDIGEFLKRYPESELTRLKRVSLNRNFGWIDDAVEELDRVIEMNGAYLKEACLIRAELLAKTDPESAKRDRETVAEIESGKRNLPPLAAVDRASVMDFALIVDPIPPCTNYKDVRQMIHESRFDEALVSSLYLCNYLLTVDIHSRIATALAERNEKSKAAKTLDAAVKFTFSDTEEHYARAQCLARIALAQGSIFGKDAAAPTLANAVRENAQTRKRESRDSAFKEIINVQLKLGLFDEAKSTINLVDNEDWKILWLYDLADSYLIHGDTVNADSYRQQADLHLPEYDYELCIFLKAAESYAKKGERDIARKHLKHTMDLAGETDFHYNMEMVGSSYYKCGMIQKFKQDIRQYPLDDIEEYLADFDDDPPV